MISIKHVVMSCFCLLAQIAVCSAEPLSRNDLDRIEARVWTETLVWEHYFAAGERPKGDLDVIGIQFDRFVNADFFVGGVAYGAVTGEAGGFALGAFHAGYKPEIMPGLFFEGRLLFGGAGGGSVKAGGGLIIEPVAAFEYRRIWTRY